MLQDGIPVAGLMDINEFEDYLELRDPKVRAHIRKSHDEYLAGKSRPPPPRPGHHIEKLEGVPLGEGQSRLSLGRFRFRYDISATRWCSSTAASGARTRTAGKPRLKERD